VHAASSLRPVCEELELVLRELRPELVLRFNFGASSDLARQVLAGAGGDLFLSADERQLERLDAAGRLRPLTRAPLCGNALVVVEPGEPASRAGFELASAADLARLERIAVADPEAVPAGVYARRWLENVGLWATLAPKIIAGIDARATLAAVESGACPAGVVYRTDALLSKRARIAFVVRPEEQPPIRYGGAVLASAPGQEAAAVLALLRGRTGALLFERFGFLPAPSDPALAGPPALESASVWPPLLVSLRIAGLATLVVFLPGVWLGWLLARKRFPGHSLLETLVALPLVLPPTAVGYLLLRTFAADGPLGARVLGFDLDLLLSWKGAVCAAALMALPLVARTARIAFEGVEPRLEAMGASLGWTRLQVLGRVTLPLARRGLLAAGVLGFSRALGEFGATVIVAGNIPGRTQTLALAIFQDIQLGRQGRATRLLLISVAIAFAAIWLVEAVLRRDRAREARP
jgi:molybdate transport system permease protein